MKDHLRALVRAASSPTAARNLGREYLQARMLAALQRSGAMTVLAFHGGTALRFLYAIARYSEDLDFTLEQHPEYNFRSYLQMIRRDFVAEGYDVDLRVSDQKTVHSAFVRFPGLLYELNISPHPSEVLAVELEVDTDPPAGAGLTTTVVRRHVILQLHHHDKASLLAGKLHAVLQRVFVKGRDLYDLIWYLSAPDWPEPNLPMLNNALQQTGWPHGQLTAANWRGAVEQRLQEADWKGVVNDVRPFLENEADGQLLSRETLLRLLAQPRPD